MFRRFGPNYMLGLYLLDLACTVAALWTAQALRLSLPFSTLVPEGGARVPQSLYVLVLLLFALVLPMVSAYDTRKIFRAVDEATRVVSGVIISNLLLAGILYLTYRGVSRLVFMYFFITAILLLIGYRAALRTFSRALRWPVVVPVKVLIGGAGLLGKQAASILSSAGVSLAGFVDDDPRLLGTTVDRLPVLGTLDEIPEVVGGEGVTDVVFALPHEAQERLSNVLVSLWRLPIHIHMIPDFSDLGFAHPQVEYLGGLTVMGLREPVIDGFQVIAKRLLDVAVGSAILVCLLPVMCAIAIAIRLDSPGPVIFRQRRVGENGRCFMMYKFRSMILDAEQRQETVNRYAHSGKVIHKAPNDPRVTRVGRTLRRFSLDELPQLVNVIRGEMSLVGPRPELPWIVEQYEPWQYQWLAVPQGMTSWYVINGRSEVPMHLNTKEDVRYVRNYSLFRDLQILLRSVVAVAKGRGAF